jgi:hypothetical protein
VTILTPGDKSTIDKARRDILKDQLYRAVASRNYPSDLRARFVQMLEELFDAGPQQYVALIVRVTIKAGESQGISPRPIILKSVAKNEIGLLDIVESEADPEPNVPTAQPRGTKVREAAVEKPRPKEAAAVAQPATGSTGVELATREPVKTQAAVGYANVEQQRFRFFVGSTASGEDVFWDPQLPSSPLNNFGILVTGDPGAGKTQVLRAILDAAQSAGIPSCVFDFKNDYSGSEFAAQAGLRVFDVERDGLPFNPLTLVGDQNGDGRPIAHIHEIASILRRIFGLGDQQEAQLKNALKETYAAHGIKVEQRQSVAGLPSPSFDEVVEMLTAGGARSVALLNRLSPLFDLGLFPNGGAAQTSFAELIAKPSVLDLHKLPDDKIKAAMAEFLIVRLHGHVLRGDQPRKLRRLLVLDEAWRVKDSERLQELAREGRAFGVGIAIGTQFPGDIPETLAGNLATQLLLQNSTNEHQKAVARTLVGSASGPVAAEVIRQTQALQKHEGFFRNQQYTPYVLVRTVPHYARQRQIG